MSFILVPKNGEEVQINAWNWRPTLELLRDAEIVDDDLFERMGIHGATAEVDAATAESIHGGRFVGYPTGGHLAVVHQAEVWSEIEKFLKAAAEGP